MTQIIILSALILYLGVMNYIDRERAHNREKDLLNRLAARDLRDYALADEKLRQGPRAKTTTINDLMKEGESDILSVD